MIATPEFSLKQNEKGQLILSQPGQEEAVGVTLRRAFPWSNPQQYISIRSAEGKELILINQLAELPAETREIATQWLSHNSFIPRITRVRRINMDFGYQQWLVDTDRGPREFRVQEREDIRFLHDGRFSVKDADGNVYELSSLESMDRDSRRVIESLL